MRAHRGKTKNASIRRRTQLRVWFVSFKLRSSVKWTGEVNSGGFSTAKRVRTVFVKQWAANGEKPEMERYGQFGELHGQGEQRSFEHSVVCLKELYFAG